MKFKPNNHYHAKRITRIYKYNPRFGTNHSEQQNRTKRFEIIMKLCIISCLFLPFFSTNKKTIYFFTASECIECVSVSGDKHTPKQYKIFYYELRINRQFCRNWTAIKFENYKLHMPQISMPCNFYASLLFTFIHIAVRSYRNFRKVLAYKLQPSLLWLWFPILLLLLFVDSVIAK